MNWELYGLFLLTGLIAAAVPGPSIAFTVSQSIRYGALSAFPSVMGLMSASILYGAGTLMGAGALLILVPEISIVARSVGAAYLAFLGFQQLTTEAVGLAEGSAEARDTLRRTYVNGLIIGLSNPKIMLFYLMFIPQFVDPTRPAVFQITVLVLSQYMVKASVLVFYAAMANSVRGWLGTKGRVNLVNKVTGVILICVAILLAFSVIMDLSRS
jgi:threonine/homoserine/homoserine lactone efflux protein